MKPTLLAFVLLVGCSHHGDVPLNVDYCIADTHVHPCDGYPKRDGAACATCDDDNWSLTCQVDTGADYLYGVCVADCSACSDVSLYDRATSTDLTGVHLCSPPRYRTSSWCATCDSDNLSLSRVLCDKDGFCDPVLCVRDCLACQIYPQ